MKWLRGIRWEQIDENLVLRHVTSNGGKHVELRLSEAPMVMTEFAKLGKRPSSGPVIVCEFSKLPWTNHEFRRWWRKVADACGIPRTVKNMDTRAPARNAESRRNREPAR
jgi:hypothetical protein